MSQSATHATWLKMTALCIIAGAQTRTNATSVFRDSTMQQDSVLSTVLDECGYADLTGSIVHDGQDCHVTLSKAKLTMTMVKVFQSLLGGETVTTAITTMRRLKGCSRAFAVKESRL